MVAMGIVAVAGKVLDEPLEKTVMLLQLLARMLLQQSWPSPGLLPFCPCQDD